MELIFRIHDEKGERLITACRVLEQLLRKHKINGQVIAVSEFLEHHRLGIANDLPALQMGGYIMGKGFELTKERLDDLCSRLSEAGKQQKP